MNFKIYIHIYIYLIQLKIFIYYYKSTNIIHGNFLNQEYIHLLMKKLKSLLKNIQRFIIIFLFLKEKFNFKYYSNIY